MNLCLRPCLAVGNPCAASVARCVKRRSRFPRVVIACLAPVPLGPSSKQVADGVAYLAESQAFAHEVRAPEGSGMTTYGTSGFCSSSSSLSSSSCASAANKVEKPAYQPYSWLFVDDDVAKNAPDTVSRNADALAARTLNRP